MTIAVTRSTWLPLLGAIVAIPLLVMALDLGFTYKIFPEPHGDSAGARSAQGSSERRTDVIWASGLALAGAVLAGASLRELVNPRVIVAADEDQVELDIGPRGNRSITLDWADINSVRSIRVDDDFGERRVLAIDLASTDAIPVKPRGAALVGDTLEIDADSWSIPSHEVADALNGMAIRSRRPGDGDGA